LTPCGPTFSSRALSMDWRTPMPLFA